MCTLCASRCWLGVCTMLALLHVCQSVKADGLIHTSNVVLDKTQVTVPYKLKGICATFVNTNPINIQVWSPIGASDRRYRLEWEVQVSANKRGRQKLDLHSSKYHNLNTGDMVGVYNPELPGPIEEVYNLDSSVVLSLYKREETSTLPAKKWDIVEFDDLQMPYQIPVFLCSTEDCSDCDDDSIAVHGGSTKPPGGDDGSKGTATPGPNSIGKNNGGYPGSERRGTKLGQSAAWVGSHVETILHSTEFMIGMIAWNIVLTILIFILMCVIMCLVNDNERRNKRERRLNRMRQNDAYANSYSQIDTLEVEKRTAQDEFDATRSSSADSTYAQPVTPEPE